MATGRENSPGRGRGRGRGQRQGRRRNQISEGRRLFRHEINEIVSIFAQLNRDSRVQLVTLLQGLLGESSPGPVSGPPPERSSDPPVSGATGPSPQKSPPRRTRVYDREIIRNLPGVREFAKMNSTDRGNHPEVNRLMSIASGVISRARKLGHPDENIERFIIQNSDNFEALSLSYTIPPQGQPEAEANGDNEGGQSVQGNGAASEKSVNNPRELGSPLQKGDSWADACETSSEKSENEEMDETGDGEPSKQNPNKKRKHSPAVSFKTDNIDKSSKPPPGTGPPGAGGGTAITA